MTPLAQALQVTAIGKQSEVATVGNHVVNHRSSRPSAITGAPATVGLQKQLLRPQPISPHWQVVQPMPVAGLTAPLLLGLMSLAVPTAHQLTAPDFATRSQWLHRHAITPQNAKKACAPSRWCSVTKAQAQGTGAEYALVGNKKKPDPKTTLVMIGSGSMAQARFDVHHRFLVALFAKE